jgi:oxygen-dependent protoporphyrinogen oxidase
MLSGVYGGPPERLRLESIVPRFAEIERKYGSISRGLLRLAKPSSGPLFHSILGGMQKLTEALAEKISSPITAAATGISRSQAGYEVRFGSQSAIVDSVVLAIPAYRSGALLRTSDSDLADRLETIPYSSSIVTGFAYERDQLDHPTNGFGFLVPRSENRALAACTWVHKKFPNRAPADRALLRAFIAGEKADARMSESDEKLADDSETELQRMMGYQGRAMSNRVFRWPRAMAQYETGHARTLDWIRGRLKQHPNLYLCGNAYEGIGIPDCVRLAKQAAERIAGGDGA